MKELTVRYQDTRAVAPLYHMSDIDHYHADAFVALDRDAEILFADYEHDSNLRPYGHLYHRLIVWRMPRPTTYTARSINGLLDAVKPLAQAIISDDGGRDELDGEAEFLRRQANQMIGSYCWDRARHDTVVDSISDLYCDYGDIIYAAAGRKADVSGWDAIAKKIMASIADQADGRCRFGFTAAELGHCLANRFAVRVA